jgi:type II secretion system protein N
MNMERLLEWLTAPLSRGFKFVVMPVLAFALIAFFVFLGFPYDVVADRIIDVAEQQTGATIRYASLAPRITIGGPGFRFREVDVILPDGKRYSADPVSVRPAWSLGWLKGEVAVRADLASEHGDVAGVATLGRAVGWDGTITGLDLSVIPIRIGDEVALEGRADIQARVVVRDDGPEGEIDIQARDGEFSHTAVPIPVEFDTLEGHVVLGGDKLALIERLDLEGPLLAVLLSGDVGRAAVAGQEPLDIAIDITVREAGLQQMARNLGLPLDDQGRARLDVGGTLSTP